MTKHIPGLIPEGERKINLESRKDSLRFGAVISRLKEIVGQLDFLKDDALILGTLNKLEKHEMVSDEELFQLQTTIKHMEGTDVMNSYGETANTLLPVLLENAIYNNVKGKTHGILTRSGVGASLGRTGGY
ncbi:hypothetical protein EOM39_05870 [Candidatus Gracilibacteria bacterium]|nr:hypothetical protein [Candidatus Gracilibacteria bacterium]